mgnify:CR=1 FL=1
MLTRKYEVGSEIRYLHATLTMRTLFITSVALFLSALPGALNAQIKNGNFLKIGLNTSYTQNWSHYDLLMTELNDANPWFDRKPRWSGKGGGPAISFGAAAGWKGYWEINYSSMRMIAKYDGTDPTNNEYSQGTYVVNQKWLGFNYGYNILPTRYVRIGVYAGIGLAPVSIRYTNSNYLWRTIFAAVFLPMFVRNPFEQVNLRCWGGAKLGANVQLGERGGMVVEPFVVIPAWKVSVNKAREEITGSYTSPYTKDQFRNDNPYWGIKYTILIGKPEKKK